jgi:cysteine desulfurase
MIYLDHCATSPMLPEVRDAMLPWMGVPANPASAHQLGQRAAAALERARADIAALVGARASGVVFTAGATEANHQFLRGIVRVRTGPLWVSAIEHPCVRAAALASGVEVWTAPVGSDGVVPPVSVPSSVAAIAIMAVNHETGVIQDVDGWMRAASAAGVPVHVDAAQAAGKIHLNLRGAAGIALSAHKISGPAGVGALVLPDGEPFPALYVGSQERGRRGGTVNVAGAVGFGVAARLARERLEERATRLRGLQAEVDGVLRAGGGRVIGAQRSPNVSCAVFEGLAGETLVQALDLRGVCVSSGAACASGSVQVSPVLRAMGEPLAGGALRVSLGPSTTEADIAAFAEALPAVLAALRADGGPDAW